MDKKIICSTSLYSVGCTFMDWSILYLNGRNNFFSVKNNQLENLVSNPLTSSTSHLHKKNHPNGFAVTKSYIDIFLSSDTDLLTLYAFSIQHNVASDLLGIAEYELTNPESEKLVVNFQLDDHAKMCEYIQDIGAKLIFIDHNMPMFNIGMRSMDKLFRENRPVSSVEESREKHQSVYFPESTSIWKDLGLTNIWDTREHLALCTRPLNELNRAKFNQDKPHCFLDSREWVTTGTTTIKKVMDFCELSIDNNRWDVWTNIYYKWQELHHNNLNFHYQLPYIIDAIINDKFYKINLTFDQEVVVQHCLIYQHNLNLKTWQLEKFPNNTQDLHKLLENNIHLLEDV